MSLRELFLALTLEPEADLNCSSIKTAFQSTLERSPEDEYGSNSPAVIPTPRPKGRKRHHSTAFFIQYYVEGFLSLFKQLDFGLTAHDKWLVYNPLDQRTHEPILENGVYDDPRQFGIFTGGRSMGDSWTKPYWTGPNEYIGSTGRTGGSDNTDGGASGGLHDSAGVLLANMQNGPGTRQLQQLMMGAAAADMAKDAIMGAGSEKSGMDAMYGINTVSDEEAAEAAHGPEPERRVRLMRGDFPIAGERVFRFGHFGRQGQVLKGTGKIEPMRFRNRAYGAYKRQHGDYGSMEGGGGFEDFFDPDGVLDPANIKKQYENQETPEFDEYRDACFEHAYTGAMYGPATPEKYMDGGYDAWETPRCKAAKIKLADQEIVFSR